MKGLILKDLYNMKKQGRLVLVMIVFYLCMSLFDGNPELLIGVLSIMMISLTITALAYDERSHWDRYALTMPVSRSDLVLEKYILGSILSVAAFIINTIFLLVTGEGNPFETFGISAAVMGISLFFLLIILPVLFKFGVEKGRLLMLLIIFIPTGAAMLLSRSGLTPPGEDFMRILPYLCVAILIILAYASVQISLAIYRKKEM